ncbi:MAG: PDZ domain-containing protein [Opitutaceae bacterium]|nr:PDZ domain-containing protein [Opitutaceae bacterium]
MIHSFSGRRPHSRGGPRRFARRGLLLTFTALTWTSLPAANTADLPALWAERVKSVVAVEYMTVTEVERQPSVSMGTVIDGNGTIILPSGAVDPRTALWELKDFKVYLPGDAASTPGEYLGQDAFTGWHFVRASEKIRGQLTPISAFAPKTPPRAPALADFVWGIGLRNKDEDFAPYILQSNLALVQSLPQRTGIAQQEVAAPGLPVFNRDGVLVGLAQASFGQSFLQISRANRGSGVILINVEESSAFILAEEMLPHFGRIPKQPSGRPLAWLGTYGLQPMDREVARFLNLSAQSAVVVSEVLEGSPAEKAGLKDRDIILQLDGRPLPQFKPDRVIVSHVEREIDRHAPGDTLALTVLRGTERIELKAVLGEQPKVMREAERKFFDRLGFTAREFVYGDGIERRVKPTEPTGIIVHHVKSSSPVAIAGLRQEDWVKEIDGVEIKTFKDAVVKLDEIERDQARPEFVLLVSRGGDTAVLRVKLR